NAHDLTPKGQPLALNTPTVFNASLNFRLNWEGNFRSLEDHAKQTLGNPAIMASSADEVVSKLRADLEIVRQFREAYGKGPDVAVLLDAIATYERSLVTPGSRFDRGPADRLAATVSQQEELTERFKTSNALLQNSLSYVGLLSTSPEFGAQDAQLAPATGALAAALLYLTRDTSPDAVKVLQERIDRLASQAPTMGPGAEAARALLAHSRLLQELLPAIDETLKALAAPSKQPFEEVRALFSKRRSAVEATAQRFRLL